MRLVVIGFGKIAKKHLEVFKVQGCKIVASCNRSEAGNAKAIAAGIEKTYTNYHQMIKECQPDGIILSVSFWNNFEITKELIPYEVPILLEKPSGVSLKEHLEIIDLQKKYKTPILLGLNRRHYSVLNKAVEDAGGRDNITSILVEWSEQPRYLLEKKNYTPKQVSQMIFSYSIHGLDIITYLVGELESYQIYTKSYGKPFKRMMNLSGQTANGCVVNFYSSWTNHIPWRVVFTTKNKRYVFAPLEKCIKTEVVDGKRISSEVLSEEVDIQFKAGMYSQAEIFIEVIKTREIPMKYSLESVTSSMELAENLTKSFEV